MADDLTMVVTNNNLPLLALLDPLMRSSLKKTMGEIGEILQKTAVEAIQNQTPPGKVVWPELNEWYLEWKKEKGYSEQIYIMTSSYMQAITWKLEESDNDFQTVVGVMRNAGFASKGMFSENGAPIWFIAEILEYGWEQFNVKIPPRPLWRPTLEVNRHKIQTRVGTSIYWATQKIAAMAEGNVIP